MRLADAPPEASNVVVVTNETYVRTPPWGTRFHRTAQRRYRLGTAISALSYDGSAADITDATVEFDGLGSDLDCDLSSDLDGSAAGWADFGDPVVDGSLFDVPVFDGSDFDRSNVGSVAR